MGAVLVLYIAQAVSGLAVRARRLDSKDRGTLATLHRLLGVGLVALVLLLLAIGVVGTLGHFGSLGHSPHLGAGIAVVGLVLVSAWSSSQIPQGRPWARPVHLALNGLLCAALAFVLTTGWQVVQKYLPERAEACGGLRSTQVPPLNGGDLSHGPS
jgi:hypothetical protein